MMMFCLLLMLPLWPTGCSDDDPEAPKVENITRTWRLTSCEYIHETNAALHVDLVADGWVIVLYINDNGAFRYAWTPTGGSEEYYDGTWSIDGDTVSLTREGYGFSWQFTAQVQEESMTMRGAHVEYDFDGDGTPEPAIWNLAMET
jgi:hypothetical protein